MCTWHDFLYYVLILEYTRLSKSSKINISTLYSQIAGSFYQTINLTVSKNARSEFPVRK